MTGAVMGMPDKDWQKDRNREAWTLGARIQLRCACRRPAAGLGLTRALQLQPASQLAWEAQEIPVREANVRRQGPVGWPAAKWLTLPLAVAPSPPGRVWRAALHPLVPPSLHSANCFKKRPEARHEGGGGLSPGLCRPKGEGQERGGRQAGASTRKKAGAAHA